MMANEWAIKLTPIGDGTTDRSTEFRAHLIRQIEQCMERVGTEVTWHPSCDASGTFTETKCKFRRNDHD